MARRKKAATLSTKQTEKMSSHAQNASLLQSLSVDDLRRILLSGFDRENKAGFAPFNFTSKAAAEVQLEQLFEETDLQAQIKFRDALANAITEVMLPNYEDSESKELLEALIEFAAPLGVTEIAAPLKQWANRFVREPALMRHDIDLTTTILVALSHLRGVRDVTKTLEAIYSTLPTSQSEVKSGLPLELSALLFNILCEIRPSAYPKYLVPFLLSLELEDNECQKGEQRFELEFVFATFAENITMQMFAQQFSKIDRMYDHRALRLVQEYLLFHPRFAPFEVSYNTNGVHLLSYVQSIFSIAISKPVELMYSGLLTRISETSLRDQNNELDRLMTLRVA